MIRKVRAVYLDELRADLDAAILGKLCIETWLGYGRVLFLGFGDDKSSFILSGRQCSHPQYQLQTNYADWVVEDDTGLVGTADDEFAAAEAAARRLNGKKAIGWRFIGSSFALEIEFDTGLKLRITPMADADCSMLHSEAWRLRMPDGHYRHVRWDGTAYSVAGDELPSV